MQINFSSDLTTTSRLQTLDSRLYTVGQLGQLMGFSWRLRINSRKHSTSSQSSAVSILDGARARIINCGDRWSSSRYGVQFALTSWFVLVVLLPIHIVAGQSPKPSGSADQRAKTAPGKAGSRPDAIAEAGAVSNSVLALPFRRSWEYLTKSMILVAPTVDRDRIYQPLQEGRVICLDRRSGALLWSSDSGGRVTAPVATGVTEGAPVVFISSEKLGDSDGSSSGLLRALDPITGVALWARDYPRPFTSPIVSTTDRLYVGGVDGALYAISPVDGRVIWKVQTQNVVAAGVQVTDNAIYFGSDDGALRALNPETGREIWKYQTTGRIGSLPAIDDKHVYFGSADGCLYALDLLDGKLKWKSRTGAAVEATPVLAGDRLLVGSLDNFLYAISRSTGDRLWKRRLDNRIVSPVIVQGDALMVAPFRGDHVPIFLLADGRRVNYYRLNRGYEIVASPAFVDGTLLVPTDKGLVAAVAGSAADAEDALKRSKGQTPAAEPAKKPLQPLNWLPQVHTPDSRLPTQDSGLNTQDSGLPRAV